MTEIVNDAFFVAGGETNITDAPDLLTAIAMFYASKGNFTQSAIQGQLNEMKGDQKKMEMLNESLAYLRAANSAKDGDTFTVSAATFETLIAPSGADGVQAENQTAIQSTQRDAAGHPVSYTVRFNSPGASDSHATKTNQNNIDKLKSQLDTMNNTSQLKMLSLNKYMDNLSTITSTAANAQKTVGDMNSGIAQKM